MLTALVNIIVLINTMFDKRFSKSFHAGDRDRTYVGTKPRDFLNLFKERLCEGKLGFLALESLPFDHSGTPAEIRDKTIF